MADENWENALKLVQDGNIREAHSLFERIVSTDIHNVSAWFWYAKTGASEAERRRILQNCLRFNPESAETRQVLGLASLPEPQPESASPAQRTGNSVSFTSTGSASPEGDSSESTKPLKAYAPAVPPPAAAPTVVKNRVPLWLVLLLAALLLVFLGFAAWVALTSRGF